MGRCSGVAATGRCKAARGSRERRFRLWEHRGCRGTGGAHPGRVLDVRNVATPLGSTRPRVCGQPTVRKAQVPSGQRMTQKRTPAAETQQETETTMRRTPPVGLGGTGRIRALLPDSKEG